MELRSRKIAAEQGANDSPGPVGATPTKRTRSSSGSPSKASKEEAGPGPSTAPAQGLARTGKLLFFTMGIWTCFINWGIVQQRITTFGYENQETKELDRWKHMVVANMLMGATAAVIGVVSFAVHSKFGGTGAPPLLFIRPAVTNTIASPIGYLSLTYNLISYPLNLLVKNCKLVPVMLVGALVNKITYSRRDYAAVAIISSGVLVFMMKPHKAHADGPTGAGEAGLCGVLDDKANLLGLMVGCAGHWLRSAGAVLASSITLKELLGVGLASTNLLIDGFTNAEQDRINRAYHPSPFYMMAMVNFWSVCLALAFLLCRYLYLGAHSEIAESFAFLAAHPSFRADLLLFCISNAVGQVFIFATIKDFGPLVSTTVAITRKLVNVGLSIVRGTDPVYWWHWVGVTLVFAGVGLGALPGGHKQKGH